MKNLVKGLVVAGALFGGGLAGLDAAAAMPIAPAAGALGATAPIEAVGWRCGYGAHVNAWGHCVPNRYYGYGYRRPYWRRHYYHRHYHRRYW